MKRDALKEHGLTDEQIDFVMAENGKEVNALNEKVNGLTSERDGLQRQITDRDGQLNDLKRSAKGNDELQAQIKQLQDDNKATIAKYQSDLATQAKSFKIESALRDAKARNVKSVLPLIDTDKVQVAKDGSLSGLTDQLDAVKKSDSYLFEADKPTKVNISHGFQDNGNSGDGDSLTTKIAERMAHNNE